MVSSGNGRPAHGTPGNSFDLRYYDSEWSEIEELTLLGIKAGAAAIHASNWFFAQTHPVDPSYDFPLLLWRAEHLCVEVRRG
jgi:hypothetical protein